VANSYDFRRISVECLWLVLHVETNFILTLSWVAPKKVYIWIFYQISLECLIKLSAAFVGFFLPEKYFHGVAGCETGGIIKLPPIAGATRSI
jgi:hypothetical protein